MTGASNYMPQIGSYYLSLHLIPASGATIVNCAQVNTKHICESLGQKQSRKYNTDSEQWLWHVITRIFRNWFQVCFTLTLGVWISVRFTQVCNNLQFATYYHYNQAFSLFVDDQRISPLYNGKRSRLVSTYHLFINWPQFVWGEYINKVFFATV